MNNKFLYLAYSHKYAMIGLFSCILTIMMFSNCTDKDILEPTSNSLLNGEHGGNTNDITSTISIEGDADMERPPIKGINENGKETRAVVLNDNFMPVKDGSDITARIFLVKYDSKLYDEYGRFDDKKCELAAGEIKFDNVTDIKNGGVHFEIKKPQKITLHWVNQTDKPIDIKPDEDWRIVGIIGGAYKPSYKSTNLKKYYTYVDFDPYNPYLSKLHNTKDKFGRQRVAAAFATSWMKLNIKKENTINLLKFDFKPLGTLFKIKVHRNTDLIGRKAHCYRFVSSQMTASGGFEIGINQEDGLHRTTFNPEDTSIVNEWLWNDEMDETKYFWLHQNEKSTGGNDRSYEFHYVYDSEKMRNDTQNEYDIFYVWGMPFDKTTEDNATLDNMTCITLEKGGAMLGKKHISKNKVYYADEWCYGDGGTDEWAPFNNLRDKSGKGIMGMAYNVELKVIYPKFSNTENGKPKFPWPNQLERFAKTICTTKIDKPGFAEEVFFKNSNKNYGKVDGYTITPIELKRRDVNNINWIYPNFMVPSNNQWAIAIPNNLGEYSDNLEFGYNGVKGADAYFERKAYNEIFFMKDDTKFPLDNNYEKSYLNAHKETNKFWSFFYPNKSIREFYAIRFDADKDNENHYGRRYRCAYRYRFINMGYLPTKDKDDGTCATFDNVKDSYGNIGSRLVIQSRWIGNAYVPLDSLQSETWWGKSSLSDGDFSKVDCYRVFPVVGYNAERNYRGLFGNYLTRTYYDIRNLNEYYKYLEYYMTRYFRRFGNDHFGRGYDAKGNYKEYPIMAIIKFDYPENGRESPKNRIVPNYDQCIYRKWDYDNSWRTRDKKYTEFNKENFKVKYRR